MEENQKLTHECLKAHMVKPCIRLCPRSCARSCLQVHMPVHCKLALYRSRCPVICPSCTHHVPIAHILRRCSARGTWWTGTSRPLWLWPSGLLRCLPPPPPCRGSLSPPTADACLPHAWYVHSPRYSPLSCTNMYQPATYSKPYPSLLGRRPSRLGSRCQPSPNPAPWPDTVC